MKMHDLTMYLQLLQQHFATIVNDYLPKPEQEITGLHSAMHYAVQNGGKRLRPILVYLTGELLNIAQTKLDVCAVSVELIHAYSLIHDDLPAMDNSELRRGQLTCHLAFDEATAILAGDCLQTLAFEILINSAANISGKQRLQMLAILTQVSGYQGMGGGQAQDLFFTGKQPSCEQILQLYRLKTGALIQACIMLPMQLIKLSAVKQRALIEFGDRLGLLFQIQDDILDYEMDSTVLGKPQHLDWLNQKHTIVNAVGMAAAKAMVTEYAKDAVAILGKHFASSSALNLFTQYLSMRRT